MEYELIRSDRRTVGLEIRDGRLVVRAPRRMSVRELESLLEQKRGWIDAHLRKAAAQAGEALPKLSGEELHTLAQQAREVIPQRVKHFAGLLGVEYGSITIRAQKTRWGSCSAKGNLNFNCLLMLTPPEIVDSVVVHELCHRKELNHSPRFYQEVLRILPDYRRRDAWLKENGAKLLRRLP